MIKTFTLILACAITFTVKAQTTPATQPFGKIDKADLELKSCDFEKDANAMILFNKAEVYYDQQANIVSNRHRRTKIFNTNAKDEGNVRIEYYSANRMQYITGLQAQTINLNNGNIEIIKVDKKQIFTEVVDKNHSALVFSFPNVQPGSVLEYKYTVTDQRFWNFPDWYFQGDLPNRYSELKTNIHELLYFKNLENRVQPYAVDKTDGSNTRTRAIANIPSIPDEPFMTTKADNAQRLLFQLLSIKGGFSQNFSDTWAKVGADMMDDEELGGQLGKKLTGEEVIIAKAKAMKTDDEKIAYIFAEVKNTMKWNERYEKYAEDGVSKAWEKKTGSSGEMNMMVCHLLKKAGVKVYPMLTSTRSNGKVNPGYPNSYQFNNVVAYIPVDSTKQYVLDASNKYNLYNQVPANLLNTFGLAMNKDANSYEMIFLQNENPIKQFVLVNAEIKPDSKVTGTASLVNYGYKKVNAVEKYKTAGEKKYIDYLRDDNNSLKISNIKMEDMDIDTLPLKQSMDFNLDLTGSDDNYIYLNPNVLGAAKTSPFLSTNRFTDIDFGYRNGFTLVGRYKIPAGYKVESLPKSASMAMPDASITFRRIIAEQDGTIAVRYVIDSKKSIFFKEDYPDFHEFYKRMYEMMNEQIVLKKS
ncbi:DUF3857 domain-containing protein [Mucilaginibacter sp. ZT4R22]|uniref:DUF3857 domain-containing protein n=1 Tax=Mucilaginibacter pankratovii TaxID=2772110 RepID=A0ABR7WQV3_9SPHI|nr:DUF3857 domain-containing protein [Mucilaginibacter pankratovii]MBD1364677.1 DUF3857 domain-containing protein [Mucilaginibacter pankratovii]